MEENMNNNVQNNQTVNQTNQANVGNNQNNYNQNQNNYIPNSYAQNGYNNQYIPNNVAYTNYNTKPNKNRASGKTIAGFVLSIISLITFLFWYISLPCSIIAIIMGAKGIKKNESLSKPTLVIGIIGLIATIFVYITCLIQLIIY